ncbi:hypothetical protein [Rhizobium laguerreae]|uniref:hypothetical protein n=1 Tax=Rhizobium laguerreae TaxID=1076926 RepID=UPI001C91B858|nr:hypothetical protein [Rhizobium laguerreae]MBY3201320.1 hypothetical protein [Rhizobium laguerreae]
MQLRDLVADLRILQSIHYCASDFEWWIDRFGVTGTRPIDFCNALASGIPFPFDAELVALSPAERQAGFELVGRDSGGVVYEAARSFSLSESVFYQGFLDIRTDMRDHGYGTLLAANCYNLAMSYGISRISVYAVDSGAYVWARAGFLPSQESWVSHDCRGEIEEHLLRIDVEPNQRRLVEKLLSRSAPETIWAIADNPYLVESSNFPGTQIKLGRALLAESKASWRGTINFQEHDLHDRQHLRAARYMGL